MKYVQADPSKCKGVRACEKACATTFFKQENAAYSSIQVTEIDGAFAINVCNQCGKCIEICPVKAIYRNPAGTVMVKKDVCVGCYMCIGFCPTLSMRRAPGSNTAFKCVSCGKCVKECPEGALSLVEADHSGLPS